MNTPSPQPTKKPWFPRAIILGLLLLLLSYSLSIIALIPAGNSPGGKLNILLLGVDERKGDRGRSDSMIVLSIDYWSKKVKVLSFPRDTRVTIPGYGYEKANAAYAYGGAPLAVKTVSGVLGIPIHNYVITNFNALVTVVDRLGGVIIAVDKPMRYDDPYQNLRINIKAGTQVMDGTTALHYARYRSDPEGDISRTRRQQTLITAIIKKAAEPKSWSLLPTLYQDFKATVKTDIPVGRLPFLGASLLFGAAKGIETRTLPGKALAISGGSYWVVEPKEVRSVMEQFLMIPVK